MKSVPTNGQWKDGATLLFTKPSVAHVFEFVYVGLKLQRNQRFRSLGPQIRKHQAQQGSGLLAVESNRPTPRASAPRFLMVKTAPQYGVQPLHRWSVGIAERDLEVRRTCAVLALELLNFDLDTPFSVKETSDVGDVILSHCTG